MEYLIIAGAVIAFNVIVLLFGADSRESGVGGPRTFGLLR